MRITISNDEGVVHGEYIVVQDEPDTIEEMDALDASGVEDRDTILMSLAHDIPIYLKKEAEDNG